MKIVTLLGFAIAHLCVTTCDSMIISNFYPENGNRSEDYTELGLKPMFDRISRDTAEDKAWVMVIPQPIQDRDYRNFEIARRNKTVNVNGANDEKFNIWGLARDIRMLPTEFRIMKFNTSENADRTNLDIEMVIMSEKIRLIHDLVFGGTWQSHKVDLPALTNVTSKFGKVELWCKLMNIRMAKTEYGTLYLRITDKMKTNCQLRSIDPSSITVKHNGQKINPATTAGSRSVAPSDVQSMVQNFAWKHGSFFSDIMKSLIEGSFNDEYYEYNK